MHRNKILIPATIFLAAAMISGCATTGDQLTNTVYHNNRMLRNLEGNLGDSVDLLNSTVADLSQRIDSTDREIRELQGKSEEVNHRLSTMGQQLEQFIQTYYRREGLSPGDMVFGPPEIRSPESDDPMAPSPLDEPTPRPFDESEEALTAVAAYQEAQKTFVDGDYQTALQKFDDFLRRFQDTEYAHNAQFWKAQSFFEMAEQDGDSDRYERAIAEFERLRANFPTSNKVPIAMHNQAAAHLRLGQNSRAIEMLQQLVDNYPVSAPAVRARQRLDELERN